MSGADEDIRERMAELNDLKRKRIAGLPPCGFCSGKGQLGDDRIFSMCSVCRGMKVDMGALYALRQKWGEVP